MVANSTTRQPNYHFSYSFTNEFFSDILHEHDMKNIKIYVAIDRGKLVE